MTGRPFYIYTGGSPLMHTPMHLNQSDMYGFFIKGELRKLQASVDATLNCAAAGRLRFQALSPYVMLTFTRVNHAQSSFPVDYNKGWGKEIDIITWIMVGQMDERGKLARVFSYPFHIWVDVDMAITIGREIFGYPKNGCTYSMPEVGGDPDKFTLATTGFQPFTPETQLASHPLLEVTATDKRGAHRPIGSFFELLREGFKLLRSEPEFFNVDAAGAEDLLGLLLRPHVDQIFLKQFPDSTGVRAVYQAIVTSPATVDKVHSAHLLGYAYQCTLHKFDNFPLNETLGLKLGAQPVLLPFNIYFDFTVSAGEELVDNSRVAPEKIAILGGGVGAMTTAFFLTEQPGWQNNYDVTVYQQGWRLGGKGASGRNAELGQRIEEHGLHIWFGFYDNAFAMMQKAYAALQRPAGAPLATWQDAFKPQHFIALTERINNEWRIWPIDTPMKPGEPGHGNEELTLWQMALTLYSWMKEWLHELEANHAPASASPTTAPNEDWLHRLAHWVKAEAASLGQDLRGIASAVHQFAHELAQDVSSHAPEHHAWLISALKHLKQGMHERFAARLDGNDTLRRLFICADLAICTLRGMHVDGVFRSGFDVINDIEFRDWLRKYGANERYSVNSAPVIGLYDLVFAYEDGDFARPNIEAGTMLRGILRMAITYHGGIMWKMQAGMGDVVFTPLYQVLKARGVKFKFFHQVDELVPDGEGVGQIRLTRQVELADPACEYDPLVMVKDLACWPSAPNYDQVNAKQAQLLQANNVNLESYWSNWPELYRERFGAPLPTVTLQRGRDFDKVVLGVSLASVPLLCPKLLERSVALRATTQEVKTVATQAYQVWLSKDIAALGWTALGQGKQEPVLSSFTEPFDTWAPMDQLLEREQWPAELEPKNVSYFCSALPMANYPPQSEHNFPDQCAQQVKRSAVAQLESEIVNLWPRFGARGDCQWSYLIDPKRGSGSQRFDSQYWRANVDPSERYVLSVVGSTRHRLPTDGAGFNNLYLTGDWIKTGLNAGCVEAAAMAGMQAARAISGLPLVIKGERDN